MFTDTHCHISKNDYNIDRLIEDAHDNDITKMINNGSDLNSNFEVLEISKKYQCIYPALGFHPDSIDELKEEDLNIIIENMDKIVAIGEIGLDYHYGQDNKAKQLELFEYQLKIAEKYNKPVIIHMRDALEDTIDTLKKHPRLRGIIHCFSGSYETAMIFIKMGFKLGVGGVSTFKNAKLKDVIKRLPIDSFVLETDSPYLSPEPVRGTKNEPKNIHYIAEFIAKELNIEMEELSKITEKNVHEIFDI